MNVDLIKYVTSLLSAQCFVYAQEDLKNNKSLYYKGKVKEKADALVISITQNLNNDIAKLYKNDEIQAMEMTRSIQKIAELIAKNDGVALTIIDQMLQQGMDFSKYKLVEIE